MEHFLASYGVIGVFIGSAFEGQTAVIVGGLLAKQHLLALWSVVLSATAGSGLIDQLLFVAGRRFRDHRLVLRATEQAAFAKALSFIERYPISYILAFRFLFGLRLVSPIAIGVSQVPTWRFVVLNLVAAVLWAVVFTAVGYGAAGALHRLFHGHHAGRMTLAVAGGLIVGVVALAVLRWWRRRRKARREAQAAA